MDEKKLYDEKMQALLNKIVEARAIVAEMGRTGLSKKYGEPITISLTTGLRSDIHVLLHGDNIDTTQFEEVDPDGFYYHRGMVKGLRYVLTYCK